MQFIPAVLLFIHEALQLFLAVLHIFHTTLHTFLAELCFHEALELHFAVLLFSHFEAMYSYSFLQQGLYCGCGSPTMLWYACHHTGTIRDSDRTEMLQSGPKKIIGPVHGPVRGPGPWTETGTYVEEVLRRL
mgnify:CR=1 FL=1